MMALKALHTPPPPHLFFKVFLGRVVFILFVLKPLTLNIFRYHKTIIDLYYKAFGQRNYFRDASNFIL